jgi:transcriptional regulator with XRE-family HTH domain
MTHQVDWNKIADAVEMACEIRDMTLRDVAEEIGISPSGLTRLRHGKHLSADGLASLVAWLYPQRIPMWIREVS